MKKHTNPDVVANSILAYAEHFGQPVFILDQDAKLLEANDMALELLASHPAFFKPYGKFALSHPVRTVELTRKVNDAIKLGVINYLRIDDGCSGENMTAMIIPSSCQQEFSALAKNIALVTIATKSCSLPYLDPLMQTHDLTEGQKALLELFMQGLNLSDIAAKQNLKEQSVRGAFCEIYKRLGVKNKCDLVKFLCQLPKQRN